MPRDPQAVDYLSAHGLETLDGGVRKEKAGKSADGWGAGSARLGPGARPELFPGFSVRPHESDRV